MGDHAAFAGLGSTGDFTLRLLVYPHELSIGGSQINAIDLAAGAAKAGHEVVVYAVPGPLRPYIAEQGLRFIPARPLKYRPAPSRIAQLAAIAMRERIDLIHAYEWPPCLDAYFGAGLFGGTRILCTVLGMELMPAVPKSVPLIMGTPELAEQARRVQTGKVWSIELPIDTVNDHPGIDGSGFRRAHGIGPDDLMMVTVSRLALDLKADALVRAIDAAGLVAARHPVKFVLVGDGPMRDALQARADAVNAQHGREVVVLHGLEMDPRPAYAAADIFVGMGSSSLRAMAIGRPVIVQGERGFSEIFGPATVDLFMRQGLYGLADAAPGAQRLADQLETLLGDRQLRVELGAFGRRVVTERFSLERILQFQLSVYDEVLADPPARHFGDALRSARQALRIEIENHDPRVKRRRENLAALMRETARGGAWPPQEPA